ncbi:MAG: electron transfer flavoprotein subunit alpha/FixB family protein [Deltaproteobacteria bacterium]|nr:electron transfer flavoprotein subunit alpha/FixB family protein [Deltaproteobacteria bacterium]MBW1925445.1 electron transfer flavoprotein subunit alpha/FixB family protein [Deltaproteobacteria bacterium]MBW1949799.1 electron transfer flavoprotein subunit alpha/FixB family protein [Deltaproteobacteria bacterium]MBW2009494.1 electron transfer flavoprotein subunit alpha/FixB family protein [Deltaproteobacteria bacterium]MBW2103504.1 electron transfer flavoprotein subunit alpha/FixB family pro
MNDNQRHIWVFTEQRGGALHDVGLELLSKARALADEVGGTVSALLLGSDVSELTDRLAGGGADTVYLAEDPGLEPYRLLPYTSVLEAMVSEHRPEVLLMGATAMGVELAPRLAARLGTGLSAHCIDLRWNDEGHLLQVVPGWGGGVIATIACPNHRPQMATVMPGAMKASTFPDREGKIIRVDVSPPMEDSGPQVVEIKTETPSELPLEKADVIVAGGWGIGSPEKWGLIEELARLLGGAVGATRPPVDEGWTEEGRMIGQSGKTVRPSLYIGIGISGVMHHVVGMDQSGHIVSINSDPNAEIFETSDTIIVEDFNKILPPLIAELKARQGK